MGDRDNAEEWLGNSPAARGSGQVDFLPAALTAKINRKNEKHFAAPKQAFVVSVSAEGALTAVTTTHDPCALFLAA